MDVSSLTTNSPVALDESSLTEETRATKEYSETSPLFPFGDPEGVT